MSLQEKLQELKAYEHSGHWSTTKRRCPSENVASCSKWNKKYHAMLFEQELQSIVGVEGTEPWESAESDSCARSIDLGISCKFGTGIHQDMVGIGWAFICLAAEQGVFSLDQGN